MLPLSPEQRQGGRSSAQRRRGGWGPAARVGPGCEEPAPNPPLGLQRVGKSKISGAGAVGRDWGAQPSPFIVALLGWGCRAGLGCSQRGARAPQRCCPFIGPLAAHSPSVHGKSTGVGARFHPTDHPCPTWHQHVPVPAASLCSPLQQHPAFPGVCWLLGAGERENLMPLEGRQGNPKHLRPDPWRYDVPHKESASAEPHSQGLGWLLPGTSASRAGAQTCAEPARREGETGAAEPR